MGIRRWHLRAWAWGAPLRVEVRAAGEEEAQGIVMMSSSSMRWQRRTSSMATFLARRREARVEVARAAGVKSTR